MVISVKPLQFSKAKSPIVVTLFGIFMDVMLVKFANPFSAIATTGSPR
jgi:hypothetical protein